jgi:hypothetical protein
MKFVHAQNIQHQSPINQVGQKGMENNWNVQRKPERHSWAGDIKWR